MGAKDPNYVLMLIWQVLYPRNHLLSLSFVFRLEIKAGPEFPDSDEFLVSDLK